MDGGSINVACNSACTEAGGSSWKLGGSWVEAERKPHKNWWKLVEASKNPRKTAWKFVDAARSLVEAGGTWWKLGGSWVEAVRKSQKLVEAGGS